ncbi:MAG: efflux RND transporter periplasmic adaptor subunit [Deinococcaceae bacterium]
MKHNSPILDPTTSRHLKADARQSQWPLFFYTAGVLAIIGGLAFYLLKPTQERYVLRSFETATVQRKTLTETVVVSGSIEAEDTRSVVSNADGTLISLKIAEGDHVRSGQILGEIESTALEKDFLDAQQEYANAVEAVSKAHIEARGNMAELKQNLERKHSTWQKAQQDAILSRQLEKAGGVSRADLRQAERLETDTYNDYLLAQEKLRIGKAQWDIAEKAAKQKERSQKLWLERISDKHARRILRAPLSGQVVSLRAKSGMPVSTNLELFRIVGLDRFKVVSKVDEQLAKNLTVGQRVNIQLEDRSFLGRISHIAPSAEVSDKGTTVLIGVRFVQQPSIVKTGASTTLEIHTKERRNVLSLPRAAYLTTGGERLVYVIRGEKAYRREVSFGMQGENNIEVIGLQEGNRIVSSGYETFKDKPEIDVPASGELRGVR